MTDEWKQNRKIATFPSDAAHTPQNILARTLEKADRIENVVIYIEWKDGSVDADYSTLSSADLFQASAIIHQIGMDSFGRRDDQG